MNEDLPATQPSRESNAEARALFALLD